MILLECAMLTCNFTSDSDRMIAKSQHLIPSFYKNFAMRKLVGKFSRFS